MSKQPLISIPLDIPDVRVLRTDQTNAGEYILTIESTLESTTCRQCGRTITDLHGLDKSRLLRHLPILGRPVFLRIQPKRFRCPFCDDHPTTTQRLDWYDPQALHTKAYERHLILQLINATITDVTEKEDVSYDAMVSILDRWVAKTVDWTAFETIVTLGIDEIALRKGYRNFVAVITGLTASGQLHVLAVLEDRLKTSVVAFLKAIPEPHRSCISTICTDMWEGYSNAAREALPEATVVIDRFHVARQYREALDDLRLQEVRRLSKELPKEQHEDLKHTLWPLRKRAADLTAEERSQLDALFAHSPALQAAYRLREELTTIFDTARSKADGLRRIGFWRARVERSGLRCFDGFLKLLDNWLDLIANSFKRHQTSGFVEGLNNKLKVLKRRCYGLRNVGHLFQRLTLDVEGYRRFSPWSATSH
jgi:transposase